MTTTDTTFVQGIVLYARGAETLPTLRAVEKEVERINSSDTCWPPWRAHPARPMTAAAAGRRDDDQHRAAQHLVNGRLLRFLNPSG